jgi:tetratricopeptide (TPR) repeat protein
LRAALELFRERHYSSVVAVCTTALPDDETNVPLRIVLARALTALRRNEEAHRELSTCLRHEPRCAEAYRQLGQISLLRDQLPSARIFFRQAVRLDPLDTQSSELLEIVERWIQPIVAVEKLPAATATVGLFDSKRKSDACPEPSRRAPSRGRRLAVGTSSDTGETPL